MTTTINCELNQKGMLAGEEDYLPIDWRWQVSQVYVIMANIPEACENLRKGSHDELIAMTTGHDLRCARPLIRRPMGPGAEWMELKLELVRLVSSCLWLVISSVDYLFCSGALLGTSCRLPVGSFFIKTEPTLGRQ